MVGKDRGTSTIPTNEISSTDTSNIHWDDDYEYTKTDVEEKFNRELMKEELQIPSFKVAKELHNTKKVRTFVENRQLNFHIRNAL